MAIRRVSIDEVLPDVLGPVELELLGPAVAALDGVRRAAVALDQVVSRAQQEEILLGAAEPVDSQAHQDEFDEAEKQAKILEGGADCVREMGKRVGDQLPAAPKGRRPKRADEPEPDLKPDVKPHPGHEHKPGPEHHGKPGGPEHHGARDR